MAGQNPELEALSQFLGVNLKKYKLKFIDEVCGCSPFDKTSSNTILFAISSANH
jgi:hypothetical protein